MNNEQITSETKQLGFESTSSIDLFPDYILKFYWNHSLLRKRIEMCTSVTGSPQSYATFYAAANLCSCLTHYIFGVKAGIYLMSNELTISETSISLVFSVCGQSLKVGYIQKWN